MLIPRHLVHKQDCIGESTDPWWIPQLIAISAQSHLAGQILRLLCMRTATLTLLCTYMYIPTFIGTFGLLLPKAIGCCLQSGTYVFQVSML